MQATANKVMHKSGADIDVSGAQGGGEALIGGGWQGKDARVANAPETTMEAGATILANATESGNGGTAVVWSNEISKVARAIEVRGGAQSGNGGGDQRAATVRTPPPLARRYLPSLSESPGIARSTRSHAARTAGFAFSHGSVDWPFTRP